MTLTIPDGSGTDIATSSMSASPPNCTGIFNLFAAVGGTTTRNTTQVVIPPQILLQMMYGEAHGQSAQFGDNDPTEQAVGVALRNRFGDQTYFSRYTT